MATEQGAGSSGRSSTPNPSRAPTRTASDGFESEVGNTRTAETTASQLETGEPVSLPATREERIAAAAYRRAEDRDFAPGLELDDWLSAEREIDDAIAAEQSRSSTPSMR